MSPELPYLIAGLLAALGASLWLAAAMLGRADPEENAATADKKRRTAQRERAVAALQKELRELLTTRGFDLEDERSVDCLFKALDRAFPTHRVANLMYYRQPITAEESESDHTAELSATGIDQVADGI